MDFFERVMQSVEKFRERIRPKPKPEPVPPEEEEDYEEQEEEVQETPPPPPRQEPETGCEINYIPGRKQERIQVYARWSAAYPDINCIRDLLRRVHYLRVLVLVVCGTVSEDYPRKEGEEIICLSYVVSKEIPDFIAGDPNLTSATDFANELNSYVPLVSSWTYVEEISILDKEGGRGDSSV